MPSSCGIEDFLPVRSLLPSPCPATPTLAQHSVARQWNEALLETIGSDHAYPSIQARNLFHTSIALYDAWAVYGDGPEQTYLLGQTVGDFTVPFVGVPRPDDVEAARRQAMSYAAYRLIEYRFADSPGSESIFSPIDVLMADLGYDPAFTSTGLRRRRPRGLGQLHRPESDSIWLAGRIPQPFLHAYESISGSCPAGT